MLDDFVLKVKELTNEISDGTTSLVSESRRVLNRAFDKQICIGITGFSGSGKSTFITSLIHQLRYSNEAQINGFLLARDQKIIDIKLSSLPDCDLFDYDQGINALAGEPPKWPMPTSTISGCVVDIIYKRDSLLNSILGDTSTFRIEIRDYPGEWLLDLPLLEQDYWSWCQDNIEFNNQSNRKQIMGDLLQQLQSVNPFDVLTEHQINMLFDSYTKFLKQCKQEGLTFIQPARFLLPDPSQSAIPFFPLLGLHQYDVDSLNNADEACIYKVMKRRYQRYISNIVQPFFDGLFNKVDRQIVLIDVLKALSDGKENFEDMLISLTRIMNVYKYGFNRVFNKISSPRVERIIFLASKPDQVLFNQHENLRSLVNDIILYVCPQSVRNAIPIDTEVVCSVRCTKEDNKHLVGVLLNDIQHRLSHPQIPETIPKSEDWELFETWHMQQLLPPRIPGLKQGARLASIRMGTVLKDMIGDKF
ncbi:MAG: YcjX family protein [Methylophagaceae bacterium]